MPLEVDGRKSKVTDGDHVTFMDPILDRDIDRVGVGLVRVDRRTGSFGDGRERSPMVVVTVGGDDRREAVGTDEIKQSLGLCRRVDQHLGTGVGAAEQIGVVVHLANGELADGQVRQFADLGGTAYADVSGVHTRHDSDAALGSG